jgi:ankyrin repeat protein
MSAQHNFVKVKELLEQGANPNYVRYTDSDCWYSGNTHTALYSAVHNRNFNDEKAFNDTIEILLKNGANPNFKATRGGWNHCE